MHDRDGVPSRADPVPPREHPPPQIVTRPCGEPDSVLWRLSGEVHPGDLPGLVETVRAMLGACNRRNIVCDVGALEEPSAATVDALARLKLAAQRSGHEVHLLHAAPELEQLLALVGLCEVLPPCRGKVRSNDPGSLA